MKILDLKVNHFGKLENKEIEFKPHINLIYGKNESGKSSLLKYIVGMLYGISKNKNGKDISDMDKYTPWNSEDFSGKLKYELDNGESFEIFREFKKKNPKIFNENSEDVSKTFNIDKAKGNLFFYDQTKIEEELFLSSIVTEQQAVKLDQKSQNTLIQKISNIIGTGEDTVSYQKTIKNLDKRLLEEVGTLRSQDRPINIIKRKIDEIKNEKEYLEPHITEKYEISQEKENYKKESEIIKQKIEFLKELKDLKDRNVVEEEKVEVNKKIQQENKNRLDRLQENLKKYIQNNREYKNKKNILPIVTSFISIIICVIIFFIVSNLLIVLPIVALVLISNIIYTYSYLKNKYIQKKMYMKKEDEVLEIKKEIEITKKNIEEQTKQIEVMEEKIKSNNTIEKERIIKKYSDILNIAEININDHNIIMELKNTQDEYQYLILKIKSLELEEQNILPRLEKLAGIDEELEGLKEEEKELELKRENIELAKELIIKSYEKMKNEVSPKFSNNISKQMEAISNGKYKNIKLNDDKGFIIEAENGDYIPAEALSDGTIDQLYLSLRLSVLEDITNEKMPILLDETFAYFDDERLENILIYLNSKYSDRQIIIFTCTSREKELLDRLNIEYKLIRNVAIEK